MPEMCTFVSVTLRTPCNVMSSSIGVESRNGAVLRLKKHKNGTYRRLETTWDIKTHNGRDATVYGTIPMH